MDNLNLLKVLQKNKEKHTLNVVSINIFLLKEIIQVFLIFKNLTGYVNTVSTILLILYTIPKQR